MFTSDHGMTDWGSHGAGTEAELITPLVIWGRGVRGSIVKNKISQVDPYFQSSFLFYMFAVSLLHSCYGLRIAYLEILYSLFKIDLSPLMSALLGCPIPMNSFGTVPLHLLDATPRYKFAVAYANFKQVC